MDDPLIGTLLQGRYRVVSRIAEGGMGVVYCAEHVGLERKVAIKFLHETVIGDPDRRRRFEVEAKAASRVAHPNCLAVIDFGVERSIPYLVMDYVEGDTLRMLLERGPVSVERAIDLGRQVLAGLAHAHKHGIIHRDVKPENVIVFSDEIAEHAMILDFGLAKLTSAATITDGVAIGTPSYMSPEQTRGERADRRSDVYGAGVLLFELLTGKKPFVGANPFQTMEMHQQAPIPAFSEVAPDREIAPEVEAVVRRALAKEPDGRYPTAIELASALDRIFKIDRYQSGPIAVPPPRHARWPAFVAGIGVALALGIGIFLALSGDDEPAKPPAGDAPLALVSVDAAVPDAKPAVPPSAPAIDKAIEKALMQARAGREADAAWSLEQLRVTNPTNAQLSYALGQINAQRAWWGPAMTAYADALEKFPGYRDDARLVSDVVQALASDKAYSQAVTIITGTLGAAAIAELEEASRSSDVQLRYRARDVRKRIK